MIYFLTFTFSILFAYSALKFKNRMFLFIFYSILSIGFLTILGGLRNLEIGIDTSAYPIETYEMVTKSNSVIDFLRISSLIEPLYVLMSYFSVYCIYDDVHSILFVTQFLIVLNFYISFVRLRVYSPVWLSVFFFCFLFFNMCLNMQRQGIALSFVLLGYTYLINRKIIPFICLVVIAFLFHKSAIFALILIPGIYIENTKINKYLIGGCIALFVGYSLFLGYVTSYLGLEKYENYAVGGAYEGAFSKSEIILRTLFLGWIIFFTPKYKKNSLYKNVLCIFICEYIINLLQIKSAFIGRLGIYMYVLYLIYVPYFYVKKSANNRLQSSRLILMGAFIVFYWWFVYIYSNAGETYPYSSAILGL